MQSNDESLKILESNKMELKKSLSIMLTRASIENDDYLRSNVSASNTITFSAIMLANQVCSITTDETLVKETLLELTNVKSYNQSSISKCATHTCCLVGICV
jgi:1,4-dihydroxy-2-naphthoate octaprenyltransferase